MPPKVSFQSWCIQNDAELLLQFYENGDNAAPPDEIGFSSGKYVQFRCNVCGLSWSKTLNKATRKTGLPVVKTCPYCDHRKPSSFYNLAVEYPELALEWDHEKNESAPELKLPNSHEKVFWHCSNNHRWKATIRDRVRTVKKARESGKPICPYCAGEIASTTYNLAVEYPDIAREWDYVQNGDKKPEDFLPHSNEKVWWICSYNPSHHWKSRIANRTCLNRGCKHCSKEFKISYPARVLFYYLRQVCPDCVCEYPFQKSTKLTCLFLA